MWLYFTFIEGAAKTSFARAHLGIFKYHAFSLCEPFSTLLDGTGSNLQRLYLSWPDKRWIKMEGPICSILLLTTKEVSFPRREAATVHHHVPDVTHCLCGWTMFLLLFTVNSWNILFPTFHLNPLQKSPRVQLKKRQYPLIGLSASCSIYFRVWAVCITSTVLSC